MGVREVAVERREVYSSAVHSRGGGWRVLDSFFFLSAAAVFGGMLMKRSWTIDRWMKMV